MPETHSQGGYFLGKEAFYKLKQFESTSWKFATQCPIIAAPCVCILKDINCLIITFYINIFKRITVTIQMFDVLVGTCSCWVPPMQPIF